MPPWDSSTFFAYEGVNGKEKAGCFVTRSLWFVEFRGKALVQVGFRRSHLVTGLTRPCKRKKNRTKKNRREKAHEINRSEATPAARPITHQATTDSRRTTGMEGAIGRRTPAAKAEEGGGDTSSLMQASSPERFTPRELAAAEQLLQLSESSSSGGALFSPRWGEARGPLSAASASSSFSSSPRSVNNDDAPARGLPGDDVEDEEDEQEVGGMPRRNRRTRPIAEIYEASAPFGARGGRKTGAARE
ncbi:hypothetical protein ABZP36_029172 [Zizania latifolia]